MNKFSAATAYNAGKPPPNALTISRLTLAAQKLLGLTEDGKLGTKTLAALEKAFPLEPWPTPLVHPMATLADGRLPVVTSGFRVPERKTHTGCDLFYPYREGTDPPMKIG